MNVFATSADPGECARVLDDARLRKMVTETAQLVSAQARERLGDALADEVGIYKRPPSGHELWRDWLADDEALLWTTTHGRCLTDECKRRGFLPPQRPAEVLALVNLMPLFKGDADLSGRPGRFVNRARNLSKGLDYSWMPDAHQAYREYLTARWRLEAGPRGARWSYPAAPPIWSLSAD